MPAAEIAPPPVHRITLAQLVLLPLCLACWHDRFAPTRRAAGGLWPLCPRPILRRWRSAEARARRRAIARSGYAGEVGKFILSAAGFAVVFAALRPIDGPAVFGGFLAMLAYR